jgi:capsular exopolysaccharide synthesis family protein
VNSADPKFSALAANTLASAYIERTQELSAKSKEKAAEWFTGHLDELRKKVEVSQQALYLFRFQHGLLEGQQRQTVAAHKLTELDSEVLKAEMKTAEAQTRYEQIKSILHSRSESGAINWSTLDASTEVLNSSLIQSLRAQEIKVSGQVAELSEKYGPLHPKLGHVKSELQDLREKLRQEVEKIYNSLKREQDVAVARGRAIQEAVNRNKKEKIKLEQHEIEHNMLEREAESNQHLYDIFLKVAKEADLSSGLSPSNVYLADPAVPSSFPMKPKKKLNTMLGFLIGLMGGVGLAFVLEVRDQSLKGRDDLERYLPNLSLLGVVPRLLKAEIASGRLLFSSDAMDPVAESFRSIRTSVLRASSYQIPSSLLITSPGESEGKTTLAVNLATAMAQLEDTRVLLIDADLRKPSPHSIFDVLTENGSPNGLVHFLMGEATPREIVHQTHVANLSVIPRGDCPSNPSELLHSKYMTKLLSWYRQEGYHVIIDAPPVLQVTDPAVLAPQVDGVILVVSAGETTREDSRFAMQRLTTSGGKFLGVVLQKARVDDVPYYFKY